MRSSRHRLATMRTHVESSCSSNNASQEVARAAAEQFRIDNGLNDPLIIQYFRWIKGFFVGDFGHSFFYNRPISEVVWQRLPATLGIALTCHFLATLFGIGLRHIGRNATIFMG